MAKYVVVNDIDRDILLNAGVSPSDIVPSGTPGAIYVGAAGQTAPAGAFVLQGADRNATRQLVVNYLAGQPGQAGVTGAGATSQSDQLSAKGIITETLAGYGLQDLGDWAWKQYLKSGSVDYVMSQLPDQPQFQAMYPDYQQLAKNGMGMSVQQMHDYNVQMNQLASQFNLPAGFATPQVAAQYRLKGWNISAVQQQFQEASALVNNQLPAEDVNYLANELGITKGDLAAYWINPDHALPLLQNKLASAQIGGAAARQGVNLDQGIAGRLASQGVTPDQASQGFAHMAQDQQLFHALPGQGGASMGQGAQVGAEFGNDSAAEKALAQARSGRLAPFQAGGGFTGNSQGIVGAGAAQTV